MEGVLLVAALVGEADRDFLVGSGHDAGRRVPHVLENVRVDAMTDTDGVVKGDLDEVAQGRSNESDGSLHVEVIKVHLG